MPESLSEIAARHKTDKALHWHYLESYERYFEPLRNCEVRLLELGIKDGGSLLMWRDYFDSGMIVGLDIEPSPLKTTGRIRTYLGRQEDATLLHRIAAECAAGGFDIIIDDCAHIGVLARESFRHLFFDHLKSGGWYVVEDWGTAYWPSFVDGAAYPSEEKRFSPILYRSTRAANRIVQMNIPVLRDTAGWLKKLLIPRQFIRHNYGMAAFVKELIDEAAAGDRTDERFGVGVPRSSTIAEIHLFASHLFVRKA